MSNLFELLSKALVNVNAEVSFKMKRIDDSKVQVIVSSSLGAVPENATEQLQKAYMALSMPLVCQGSPAEIERDLIARIEGYAAAVNECVDVIDTMRKLLEEAQKAPAKKAAKATAKKTGGAKGAAVEEDGEEEEGEEESTDSQAVAPSVPAVDKSQSAFNEGETKNDDF